MSKFINILIGLSQIIVGIGIIAYWIFYIKVEKKNPEKTQTHITHENTFIIADLFWLMPTVFIAAVGVLISQKFGIFFSVISGSSMIFLGLIDITYCVQNGGYTTKLFDTILNLVINSTCMILGPIFIIYGWLNF